MSSDRYEDRDSSVQSVIKSCQMTQRLIEITSRQLESLRTLGNANEEIIQKEIRESETKLIKLVSRQLVDQAKLKIGRENVPEVLKEYPVVQTWLKNVGLQDNTIKIMMGDQVSMEMLLEMTETEIQSKLIACNGSKTDARHLNTALANLKMWTELQLQGEETSPGSDMELHWTVYSDKSTNSSPLNCNSPKLFRQRPSTSSLPADGTNSPATPPTPPLSNPTSPTPVSHTTEARQKYTPPPTPPLVKTPGKNKFPTTPPPQKRNKLYPEPFQPNTLTKSKSHESQLSMRINQDSENSKYSKKKPSNLTISGSTENMCKRRKSAESSESSALRINQLQSGQVSPSILSPQRSSPYKQDGYDSLEKKGQLTVPISPKTPKMMHSISHRFTTKLVVATCDICKKTIFVGKECRYCKLKFHKDCASKAAPACGLPQECINYFLESLGTSSPSSIRKIGPGSMSLPNSESSLLRQAQMIQDSSSTASSSCNSSTPSSPYVPISSSSSGTHLTAEPSPAICVTKPEDNAFVFEDFHPDDTRSLPATYYNHSDREDFINTTTSNDSDKSDKTVIDSTASERMSRMDSLESGEDGQWQRANSISQALSEWDIPYEELVIEKSEIGHGRMGTVYRGNWHGDCAVKMLKLDPEADNRAQLHAFKMEVATLRKTRHDNLVLFMGACMKPPHLGIVTSFCKGDTLHTSIHMKQDKFALNKAILVASQIATGMGYLHAKGIVHKDLKSKNVFFDNGKVVITDFGLFNLVRLCSTDSRRQDGLTIPSGWLCYLSPELMRSLTASAKQERTLPFSTATDVYAFGTVWYELLCGEYPFKHQPSEVIIWQVGKGIKPTLSNIQASRDVKDVLMRCWSFHASERPTFSNLATLLEKLPKKRLQRSPSHPVQLSRSAESVF